MSCIFHNVPRVTLWQLLGRETMQGTFLFVILSLMYHFCYIKSILDICCEFFLSRDVFSVALQVSEDGHFLTSHN